MEDQNFYNPPNRSFLHRMKKHRSGVIAFYFLLSLSIIAVFAPLIANHLPLYAKYKGHTFYPAFESLFYSNPKAEITSDSELIIFKNTDWRLLPLDAVVWCLIPYSANRPDAYNRNYVSPFGNQYMADEQGNLKPLPNRLRHFLGTNKIGLDVAAGIVHGTRIALVIGIAAMIIAGITGIVLGALAGFFGDYEVRMRLGNLMILLLLGILGYFYAFVVRNYVLIDAAALGVFSFIWALFVSLLIFSIFIFIGFMLNKILENRKLIGNKHYLRIDMFVSRFIELFDALPKLLVLITISALFKDKSLIILILILGLTSWTGIARLTRAEMLRSKRLEYMEAAKALGYSYGRIIIYHALPNVLNIVFVALAFGIAGTILAESALSFLGIGVPADIVSWGALISEGRQNYSAWWMILFPGLAIFSTITFYNLLGEAMRDAFNPMDRK